MIHFAYVKSLPKVTQVTLEQVYLALYDNNPFLKQVADYKALFTAETAASVLPRASWAYDNRAKITEYNPEKSKHILKELGLDGLKLNLWVPSASQSYQS